MAWLKDKLMTYILAIQMVLAASFARWICKVIAVLLLLKATTTETTRTFLNKRRKWEKSCIAWLMQQHTNLCNANSNYKWKLLEGNFQFPFATAWNLLLPQVSIISVINCYVCQQHFIVSPRMTTRHGEIKSNVIHEIALFNSNAN